MDDSHESTDDLIKNKLAEFAACEDDIPGIIIIINAVDFSIRYLSKRGIEVFGLNPEEPQGIGIKYPALFLKAENPAEYSASTFELLQHDNNDEIISLFQEFRTSAQHNYSWFYVGVKVLLRNMKGNPEFLIAMAIPLNPMSEMTEKTERILNDQNERLRNQQKFLSLTKRETELLKYIALGKTNEAISTELYISAETVATHRKNIKRKLGFKSNYDCTHFAQLFNLI